MNMTTRDLASNIRKINAFSSKESNRYNKYILLTDSQAKTNVNTLSNHNTLSPTYRTENKKNPMQIFTPRFRNNSKNEKQSSNIIV
jgi:hypothetical protein